MESVFQRRMIIQLKETGARVQKYTDQFANGIFDLEAGVPGSGFRIELKWVNFPKKGATKLDHGIEGTQISWGRMWNNCPSPCVFVFGSMDGWALFPVEWYEAITSWESQQLHGFFRQEKFSFKNLTERYQHMMSIKDMAKYQEGMLQGVVK